jgi:predicted DNA-binding transcriptional regulator AlpA
MRIADILEAGGNVTLSVSANDLNEFGRTMLREAKAEFEAAILAENEERYLSPAETAKMLDVDESTLWRWRKQEYFVPIRIGGKPRYRLSDIKKLLTGGDKL